MEHGGHHEEPTEAEAVDPGGNGLPVIVRQKVEVGAAEDAGNDPKLGARRGPVMQDQPPAGVPGGEAPAPPERTALPLSRPPRRRRARPRWEGPNPRCPVQELLGTCGY